MAKPKAKAAFVLILQTVFCACAWEQQTRKS